MAQFSLGSDNTTERPEGVDAGTLKLVGTNEETIYKTFKRISGTIKALGYPKSPKTLSGWIEVYRPKEKRVCRSGKAFVEYPKEVKEAAAFDFISGDSRPEDVAKRHGVNRSTLYFWKNQLLGEDYEVSKNQYTQEDVDSLKREADELRKEVRRLRLEKDVHEKAAEVLK